MKTVLSTVAAFAVGCFAAADTISVCLDGSCDYTDIQEAINAASDGDVIEISAGTYYPAATIDTIGKAVTLRGVPGKGKGGAPTTVIDGQDSIRVLRCTTGEGPDTLFENLLITGGNSGSGGGMLCFSSNATLSNCVFAGNSAQLGAGMYCYDCNPILVNCDFEGNLVTEDGGGMYCSYSSPTLTNCTFDGNSAQLGAGMYCYDCNPILVNCDFEGNLVTEDGGGMYCSYSSPTLTNCTFDGNSADIFGGGMANYDNSSPTLENCTFEGNSAWRGGGMSNYFGSNPTLTNCTFQENSAYYGGGMYNAGNIPTLIGCTFAGNFASYYGGGMYNSGSSPTLTDCTFTNNSADDSGGGMYNNQSSPTLFNCTFTDNSAEDGGGGGMYNGTDSSPTLTDCTFTGNSATGTYSRGGGMYNWESSPTLENCTFEGNSAYYGGGMYNWVDSSPTLTNCTFEGNSADYNGGGMYNTGSSPTLTNCTFEGNSADNYSGGGMYNHYYDSSPTLTNTILCGNSPDQVYGTWTDNGGNCLSFSCTDDDGDGVPDKCGGNGGAILQVPSEYPTIESAIAAAAYGDVIEISAGTYQPAEPLNTQGKPITLRGAIDKDGQPATIIDGQGAIRVLQCSSGEGADTVFENLIITGGSAYSGGGMFNYESSPTLTNCTFQENSAYYGGGMYNSGSSPTLENCTFEGNSATDNGGGMYNDDSSPTLTNSMVCGNTSGQINGSWKDNGGNCVRLVCQDTNGDGQPDCEGTGTDDYLSVPSEYATIELAIDAAAEGALIDIAAGTYMPAVTLDTLGKAITLRGAIDGEGNPATIIDGLDSMRVLRCSSGEGADTVFENLYITGGNASSGGGMANYDNSSPTLTNCTFEGNSASSGGGMYNGSSSPTLTNCTFGGNSADYYGGGMFNYGSSSSSPTLIGCTFAGNTAIRGGGMNNYYFSRPTLMNCTFAGNTAIRGGGMYSTGCFGCEGTILATGCAFIGNVATTHGGALYGEEYASVSLVECQFASNSDSESYALYNLSVATATLTDCAFDRCCAVFPITSAIDMGGNHTLYVCDGCEGDVTCDGTVDAADLGRLLAAWGPSTGRFDLNADGEVSGADLGFLFSTWGVCP